MKPWIPILALGLIAAAIRIPTYLLEQDTKKTLTSLEADGSLDLMRYKSEGPRIVPDVEFHGQSYTNVELGFSIMFPNGWTIKKPNISDSIVIKAIAPSDGSPLVGINVYAYELGSDIDFSTITPEELFRRSYPEGRRLLESGTEIVSGKRAIWMKMHGVSGGYVVHSISYDIVHSNVLFSVHGQTVGGEWSWYEANKVRLLGSIRSFRILE